MFIGQCLRESPLLKKGSSAQEPVTIATVPNVIGVVSEIALIVLSSKVVYGLTLSAGTLGWVAVALGATTLVMKVAADALNKTPTTQNALMIHAAATTVSVTFGALGIMGRISAISLGRSLNMASLVFAFSSYALQTDLK